MKKQIGIWLDFKEANIIELDQKDVNVSKIISEIEDYHPKGGARSKQPWGPMDKVSESKYLARRVQQEQKYFQKLLDYTEGADELFIFGPAEAKDKFCDLAENNKSFRPQIKGKERSDSMSINQKIAKVKAFFHR